MSEDSALLEPCGRAGGGRGERVEMGLGGQSLVKGGWELALKE